MAVLPIRLFGDPVLRTRAAEVTDFGPELHRLVEDMTDTMREFHGAGLAAPQVGVDARVFVYECGGMTGHIVNPVWEVVDDDTQTDDEGCLSIPGVRAPCTRAERVLAHGLDADGAPVALEVEGIMARCVQHETDHLDGVLYLQRLDPDVRREAMRVIRGSDWFAAGERVTVDPERHPTVRVGRPVSAE
ncbi:peptide deformylase [Williamsia sterculiae]|uniref:Peptide deformylase n=1 Tax=Williamsia sterculiae TaxID=1344003 RepID=A0A1N7EHY1_9NOCA|nr:peptide deformylase [Williamsia sterculiae]SIR87773.1 peptide deformylase [Williamsia sterculiae]